MVLIIRFLTKPWQGQGPWAGSVEVQNSHASLNGQPSGRVVLFQRARNRTPVEPFFVLLCHWVNDKIRNNPSSLSFLQTIDLIYLSIKLKA